MKNSLYLGLSLCLIGAMAAGADEKPELLPIPDKLVVLTFDDGNKSDRTFVADILKKHGFGATFYITEGLGFLKQPERYVSWKQVKELHEMGFEIGNHTQHHRGVRRLNPAEFTRSITHIEKRMAEHQITHPTTFCFPGFANDLKTVRALEKKNYQFARRGVGPEYRDGGSGGRGPAYDPKVDHPLLIPTTGYAGPKWGFEDLKWAVEKAKDGKIAVLCFHGVPGPQHPWVSTKPEDFKKYMQYLKDQGCAVIATRDLIKYVDPTKKPEDPYGPIKQRVKDKKNK